MSIKSFALAGAALVALTAGLSVAQADEQDEEVRRLNLEQLEKARADSGADTTAPAPATQDSKGGPEFKQPPAPDEGMTDEEPTADEPATEEKKPEADDPATEEEEPTSPPPE